MAEVERAKATQVRFGTPFMTSPGLSKEPNLNSSNILKEVLPNGVKVLLCERHAIRSVSCEISVLAGSRFESDETAGLASLTGRLLVEGTSSRTAEELAVAIESVGGSLDSGSGTEGSIVSATTLAKDLELGVELCADVLLQPAFLEERVVHERQKALAEIQSAKDRPRAVLDWRFNELVYRNHPLHRPSVGYEEKVARLGREQILEFHQKFFVPSNCTIAVVGDFDPARALRDLTEAFGPWSGPPVKWPDIPSIERQTAPLEEFVEMEKEQVNIYVGHLGVPRNNPDFYVLNVLDVILGSSPGFTSRIPKRLRDEQGLAYSTYANITGSAGLDPGRFVAYIGTSPENRQRATQGILQEIREVVDHSVRPDELRDAQQYLTGSFVFHFQTNAQVARFMILAERYGLGFDYIERFPGLINAVTLDDLSRAAQTYLHPEAATTVVVGPRP